MLAVLAAAIFLVACGGDEDSSSSSSDVTPEEEMQAVSDTTISYLQAIASGQGEEACAHLVPAAQEQIIDDYNASNLATFQGVDATSCEQVVESFGDFLAENAGQSEAELIQGVEQTTSPEEVELTSDTAATITVDQGEEPPFDYELVKEDDAWLLTESYVTFT